jgi:hypothetical protein
MQAQTVSSRDLPAAKTASHPIVHFQYNYPPDFVCLRSGHYWASGRKQSVKSGVLSKITSPSTREELPESRHISR